MFAGRRGVGRLWFGIAQCFPGGLVEGYQGVLGVLLQRGDEVFVAVGLKPVDRGKAGQLVGHVACFQFDQQNSRLVGCFFLSLVQGIDNIFMDFTTLCHNMG